MHLPTLNACLNTLCAGLLVLGWFSIRKRQIRRHIFLMISALLVSTTFLVSYLIYHAQVGSVPFQGIGWIRPVYFTILISHTVLAGLIIPLVGWTVWAALRKNYTRHKAWARWVLPLWLYVSVTGVVIYGMVYHWR